MYLPTYFRLARSTFNYILDHITEDLIRVNPGHKQILPKVQLMIALWRMANTETYRLVAWNRISEGTEYVSFMQLG